MVQALGAPRYIPRSPTNVLKEIIEDSLEDLERVYDDRFASQYGLLSPRVIDLFGRYLRCGDAHFGFLRLRCEDCKHELILPYSCKARGLCPSCGKRRAIEQAERMAEKVLPKVTYAPLVFTIPKMLRRAFVFDRKLYGEFCKVTYKVVRTYLEKRFPQLEKPVPAFVASAQSFGNLLNLHPHVHGLASMGVFDADGAFHEDLDVDYAELDYEFRDAFFKMMKKKDRITDEQIALIKSWPHSGFRIHAERHIPAGNTFELESLLKYMERPPISLKRLTYMNTGMVHYKGRFHPGLGRDHQLVTGVEFLAMLVPHIHLRHELRLRLYGAASTTKRKQFGWIEAREEVTDTSNCRVGSKDSEVEDFDSDFLKARRRGWARLIQKVWMDDPMLCPKCGAELKIIAAISAPHQDHIIERILRSRGEWNPPWARAGPESRRSHRSKQAAAAGSEGRHIEYDVDPSLIWTED